MENAEAILWLKSIKSKYIHGGDEGFDRKRMEAIDCAVSALISTVNINVDETEAMSVDAARLLETIKTFYDSLGKEEC
jgi:hypothetical protein